MPKSRTTCTRCSMRRQKCDRKIPCTRCVRAHVADSCTRVWKDYDARVHRSYPTTQDQDEDFEIQPFSDCLGRARREENQSSEPPVTTSSAPFIDHGSVLGTATAPHSDDCQMDRLQRLLPSGHVMHQLVDYYDDHLSWHHGGLVCMSAFREELQCSLRGTGTLRLSSIDMCWCALLFAVLGASITSAPDAVVSRWDFSPCQSQTWSREWYDATLACLHRANYTARPHINSIQAIEILSLSAHVLGFSVQQYVLFGSALRMAHSLGLHRPPKSCGQQVRDAQAALITETSRRTWLQLCLHDWFSATSADMISVNRKHCDFVLSNRGAEESAATIIENVALPADFGIYLFTLGQVLADFHDALWAVTDTSIRYETILKFDAKLRTLGSSSLPESFRSEDAPVWTRWARSCATTLQANKIILIHRGSLSDSFVDERYAYSRWASVSASRILIRELELSLLDIERPRMWNDQAHLVGASVTLCLDMFHRPKEDYEFRENRKMVSKALSLLRQCPDSTLASRGVTLIKSLLDNGRNSQTRAENAAGSRGTLAWPLESQDDINALCTTERPVTGPWGMSHPKRQIRTTTEVAGLDIGEVLQGLTDGEALDLQAAMAMDFSSEMSWFNVVEPLTTSHSAQQQLAFGSFLGDVAR